MLTAPLAFLVLSVNNLHERWLKDCVFYQDVYDQVDDVSRMPFIDWGPVFEDKQVRNLQYGSVSLHLFTCVQKHNNTIHNVHRNPVITEIDEIAVYNTVSSAVMNLY